MVRREKSNYVIQSVSHALDVLEEFCGTTDEVGVTELSKRLKLHKNNVFRLLATLEARGYVEQNKATENYRLGSKCLQIGRSFVDQIGFLRQAAGTLKGLAQKTGESAFVALRKGSGVVPLEFSEPENPVRVVSFVGISLPLHCTAPGKVHLAFESDDELRSILPESLKRYTDKTIVDQAQLLNQIKEVGESGYAVDWGEFLADMGCVAVPVWDYTRSLVGTLSIAAPTHRFSSDKLEKELVPQTLEGGKELSKRLGYQG